MSSILTTEAVVLSKSDFSNTSKIVTLYTEKAGKISAIIKGGRDKNSKTGRTVEVLNVVSIVLYNKDSRDIQLLTSADLISYFSEIREDYRTLIYAQATIELLIHLIKEHEENLRLFNGLKKILLRLNQKDESPGTLFLRFAVFIAEIIGYEVGLTECQNCNKEISGNQNPGFSSLCGPVCRDCSMKMGSVKSINEELFNGLNCLKNGKKVNLSSKEEYQLTMMLEGYLRYHVPDFPGFRALKNLN